VSRLFVLGRLGTLLSLFTVLFIAIILIIIDLCILFIVIILIIHNSDRFDLMRSLSASLLEHDTDLCLSFVWCTQV
jgi:hypothetical protein